MKRKIIGIAAAYMSGLFFASLFSGGSGFLIGFLAAAAALVTVHIAGLSYRDMILCAAAFAVAVSAGTAYRIIAEERVAAYDGVTGSFCGEVEDVAFYERGMAGYTLNGKINDTQKAKIFVYADAWDVNYGDIITIDECQFTVPENDYLFDEKNYYRSKGIFLIVENAQLSDVEQTDSYRLRRMIYSYRRSIISDFVREMGRSSGGLMSAMVFGEKSRLDEDIRTCMYRCGTGHIMAVSGLHVSIAAILLMKLLGLLRLKKGISFILMNIFLAVMIIMVKSPVSVIRAAIMLDIVYSAPLFRRQYDTLNSLALAVFVICISDPYVIYDTGFYLSAAGTFGIGVFAPYMTKDMPVKRVSERFIKSIAEMFFTMLAVMPVSIFFFTEVSLISPVTNVFLLPLCTVSMICGMLYTAAGGTFSVLLSLEKSLTDLVIYLFDKIGRLDISYLSCGSRRMFVIALACGVFVMLIYGIFRNRKLVMFALTGAFAVFSLSLAVNRFAEQSRFKIAVLGRGTRAVVVISYGGNADIFDLSGYSKAPEYVYKYLSENGISKPEALVFAKDNEAQYKSYMSELELYDIENIITAGEAAYAEDTSVISDGSVKVVNNNYSVNLDDGQLTIEYGESKVAVVSGADVSINADLTVHYGNIKKSDEPLCDGNNIYLDKLDDVYYTYDECNNFEIIIDDGEYSVKFI